LPIGSITFERVRVRGLHRSPSPAARIIAFIVLRTFFRIYTLPSNVLHKIQLSKYL
jgi:hypothetical protein